MRSYLGHVGVYFMCVMLVFGFISLATASGVVGLSLIWTALLFAVLVGLADLVFSAKFLGNRFVKTILHGILTVLSFAIAFVGVSGVIERGRTAIYGILLFTLLYVVLAVIASVYHSVCEKKDNAQQSYQNLYTPKM